MSLQKQLLVWVLGSLLLIGIVIQIAVFFYTYREFNTSQETNLSYIAELVSSRSTVRLPPIERNNEHEFDKRLPNQINRNPPNFVPPKPPTFPASTLGSHNATNASTPNTLTLNEDSNLLQYQSVKDGIQVDIIPAHFGNIDTNFVQTLPYPQLSQTAVGFSELTLDGERWKVFRKDTPRRVVIVRQPIEWQKKIALKSAWQSTIPILLTTLILFAMLPWVLKRVLRPIQALANQMSTRHGQDLTQITVPTDAQNRPTLPNELMPLVEELNALLQRVDAHIQSQNRFIADAAHELRSPLTAISLQVQQLQKYSQDTATYTDSKRQDKLKQSIDKLAVRVEHNQHLVEQLLTLARMEAKQANLTTVTDTPTDLMAVLQHTIKLLFPIADSKDQTLAVDNHLEVLGTSATQVNLDETALFIVLKNLVQNAILYTPAGGQISVRIDQSTTQELSQALSSHSDTRLTPYPVLKHGKVNSSHNESNHLVVQVIDTGIGIDPAHYQDVFQPFYRVSQNARDRTHTAQTSSDTAKGQGGTGLGLSIVYQICQQANIDIYLSANQSVKDGENAVTVAQGLTVTLVF